MNDEPGSKVMVLLGAKRFTSKLWIANQVEEHFGAKGEYLINFYHLCEYLSAAATSCEPVHERIWLDKQKKSMKLSEHQEVLLALRHHIERAIVISRIGLGN